MSYAVNWGYEDSCDKAAISAKIDRRFDSEYLVEVGVRDSFVSDYLLNGESARLSVSSDFEDASTYLISRYLSEVTAGRLHGYVDNSEIVLVGPSETEGELALLQASITIELGLECTASGENDRHIDASLLIGSIIGHHLLRNQSWFRFGGVEGLLPAGFGKYAADGSCIEVVSVMNITIVDFKMAMIRISVYCARVTEQPCPRSRLSDHSINPSLATEGCLIHNGEQVYVLGRNTQPAEYLTKLDIANRKRGYSLFLPDTSAKWTRYWCLIAGSQEALTHCNPAQTDPRPAAAADGNNSCVLVRYVTSGEERYVPSYLVVSQIASYVSGSRLRASTIAHDFAAALQKCDACDHCPTSAPVCVPIRDGLVVISETDADTAIISTQPLSSSSFSTARLLGGGGLGARLVKASSTAARERNSGDSNRKDSSSSAFLNSAHSLGSKGTNQPIAAKEIVTRETRAFDVSTSLSSTAYGDRDALLVHDGVDLPDCKKENTKATKSLLSNNAGLSCTLSTTFISTVATAVKGPSMRNMNDEGRVGENRKALIAKKPVATLEKLVAMKKASPVGQTVQTGKKRSAACDPSASSGKKHTLVSDALGAIQKEAVSYSVQEKTIMVQPQLKYADSNDADEGDDDSLSISSFEWSEDEEIENVRCKTSVANVPVRKAPSSGISAGVTTTRTDVSASKKLAEKGVEILKENLSNQMDDDDFFKDLFA